MLKVNPVAVLVFLPLFVIATLLMVPSVTYVAVMVALYLALAVVFREVTPEQSFNWLKSRSKPTKALMWVVGILFFVGIVISKITM